MEVAWGHRCGDTVAGWGQAESSALWVLAGREAEGGEGLQAQGNWACSVQPAGF